MTRFARIGPSKLPNLRTGVRICHWLRFRLVCINSADGICICNPYCKLRPKNKICISCTAKSHSDSKIQYSLQWVCLGWSTGGLSKPNNYGGGPSTTTSLKYVWALVAFKADMQNQSILAAQLPTSTSVPPGSSLEKNTTPNRKSQLDMASSLFPIIAAFFNRNIFRTHTQQSCER